MQEKPTRRELLETAGAGAAMLTLESLALSAEGTERVQRPVSANSKIGIGLIGCGGMGAFNLRELMRSPEVEVVGLCDVDSSRIQGDLETVTKKYGRAPLVYGDYRKMLENKDIHAVIVGTPDHWHALNLIHACEAGKDVYCEKPISHNIVEAKSMVGAARRFGRVVQVGTWQRSTREFVSALDYVRSGKLGKVVLVRAWKIDVATVGVYPPRTPSPGLNFEMWQGPAAAVPYVPEYTHFNWRWFMNYGSGMTGDWGVHMMDIGLLGMSATNDLPMPVEVTAYGGKLSSPDDPRTAPDTHFALMKFRNPDFTLHWQTGRRPLDHGGVSGEGTQFIASDGKTLTVWRGGWRVQDASGREIPKGDDLILPASHWQNFLECLHSRLPPRSDLASMAQTTIVCHLANAALLSGEPVHWSKEKMDIQGRAGKNTLSYRRSYRKPWSLPIYRI